MHDDAEPVRPQLSRHPHREGDVVAVGRLKATREDELLDHDGHQEQAVGLAQEREATGRRPRS